MRDYLVFIRAGKSSLHPRLLADDPKRNWDCCVNPWGEPHGAETPGATAEFHLPGGFNKFDAFVDLHAEVLSALPYRYVLMLDDDLEFEPGAVSRFFTQCERHAVGLAQPAIALGSHTNHVVNLHDPACDVRWVNFVEVMAPCFSQAALQHLLPTFRLTRCTWGIDYAWTSLRATTLPAEVGRFAVVDAVAMRHTKPMDVSDGPFYRKLMAMGVDPREELASIHRHYPAFGPLATLPDGHAYRRPGPEARNRRLMQFIEKRKLGWHLTHGGTLAPQTVPAAAPSEASAVLAT